MIPMLKSWLLNLAYIALLVILSPLLLYRAIVQGKYRRGFRQKYLGRIPRRRHVYAKAKAVDTEDSRVLWFHAVSVGEVNLLRPLLKMIAETKPNWHCVISTTSYTGMEIALKLYQANHLVFYCPLDFSWAVGKAMKRLKPDMLVLTEQELWPNMIDAAKKSGTRIAIVNGRLGETGYKNYLRIRFLIAPMLQKIDAIAVQSETYAGWFRHLGASTNAIHIIGSMKFDGASADRENPLTASLRTLAGISENDVVFLAGSTQAPEEAYAVDCYEHLKGDFPQLRLIIVPRHPERFNEVAQMLTQKGVLWERRSTLHENDLRSLEKRPPLDPHTSYEQVRPRILLVDSMGELGAWWGVASIAFVGGSLGSRGGQNMIEPAAYGAAVSFGPNTKNFHDIVELLLRNDSAVVIHDQHELERFVGRCLEDPAYPAELGARAKELVAQQLGATQRTFKMLEGLAVSG